MKSERVDEKRGRMANDEREGGVIVVDPFPLNIPKIYP
jgi:hypothetical protein